MNRDMNKEKDMEMPKAVSREEWLAAEAELLAIATTAEPAPAGDVVATVYEDGMKTAAHCMSNRCHRSR